MRFFYLDPSLFSHVGHHANTCRAVTREVKGRGIETYVGASVRLASDLKDELGAAALFTYSTYVVVDPDRIAGWLTRFLAVATATTEDLSKLPPTQASDVVFLNTAQPAQLMAIVRWLSAMPQDRRPRVVIEFGMPAGLDVKVEGDRFVFDAVNPRDDPRSVLYRFVGSNTPLDILQNLFLMTFDPIAAQGYEFITGIKTGVLPLPQQAYAPLRRMAGKRPITVSLLGHQRPGKGYSKVPPVLRVLLDRHSDIRILVHNPVPGQMPEVHAAVRDLSRQNPRLIIDERAADEKIWHELFAATDIVLCPYDPSIYQTSYSALAAEAVANGIPMVVPAQTSLSRFGAEHEAGFVAFGEYTVAAIADAASKAIVEFDQLAERAYTAAEKWNRSDRKVLLVDHILGQA